MTISYTTHLICAPELPEAAEVAVFHVKPGQQVAGDSLLITLLAADQEWQVVAPEEGQVTSLMVQRGDFVQSADLLLLMEIAEKPSADYLFDLDDGQAADPAFCAPPPVSPIVHAGLSPALSVSPAAATLAARLGLDLSRLAADELIDEDAVLEFARQELTALGKIRKLLS
ncbi:biotin/lipoyl-containing protein [Chitinibacter sp. S2-10]|uniref:biotin/lipoyl-containing protein n=1 Tax=Chitinibacter sp. S2-10 TaxID=3373597 RepID=UPI003977D55C